MKPLLSYALLALFLAAPAQAACFADYKAKKDAPLRLHYGVLEVGKPDCPPIPQVRRDAESRLSRAGWTLLDIVSVFGEEGLEERKANAGEYFLRY